MKNIAATVLSFITLLILSTSAHAKIITKDIEYKDGDVVLQGYLAYDDAIGGKLPGVLIIHEWDGLGKYVKSRAEQLAGLGYVAFGADMYGKGVRPKSVEESKKQSGIYRANRKLMRSRATAGLNALRNFEMADPLKTAAIGYCFGGGVALELARSGAPILGAVSFHGNLDTPNPEDTKNITAAILVLHGANDPNVPQKQVDAFIKEMKAANADWQMNIYGGAVHRFTNPEAGINAASGSAYNEKADRRSWQAMLLFFTEIFAR